MSNFFVDNPAQKLLLFGRLLGCFNSYSGPHSIWKCPWPAWKTFFVKLHNGAFLSAKFLSADFDNDLSIFFVEHPDQKNHLVKSLIGCIHSNSSPHFIWTSRSLDWRTLFVKLHTDIFLSANFGDDMSKFSEDTPDQKIFLFQNLLGCRHSYSSPHSSWTCPWLAWRTLFVKLLTNTSLSAKFDNDMRKIFHRKLGSKTLSVTELTMIYTLLL